MRSPLHIVVLAAGQGKRMHSTLPKVLHPVLFRPMLHHVLDQAVELSPQTLTVIVGHGEEQVRAACAGYPSVRLVRQAEQKGTGHAVQQAAPLLEKEKGRVLILSGDVILLARETLQALLDASGDAAVLTAQLPDPTGYGRILHSDDGGVRAIREHVDCSPEERAIQEVNSGVYAFGVQPLLAALKNLGSDNRQGEYYLTDVVEILVADGQNVRAVRMADHREMTGINDRLALSEVERLMRKRTNLYFMSRGVSLQDPATTWIDPRCEIAADVLIEGGCRISDSHIASGVRIEADSRIESCRIAQGAHIKQGSYLEHSEIGPECSIGPYAHLRPGSVLARGVKIGNFVEVKKSRFGEGSKANHLAYVGDAEIGKDVNLGCGFITCNYDGKSKHKTVIEEGVFVGSDSQMVAPVRVGKGSFVAAGSTVTDDVPADSLVITRGKQITKPGYGKKYRPD